MKEMKWLVKFLKSFFFFSVQNSNWNLVRTACELCCSISLSNESPEII